MTSPTPLTGTFDEVNVKNSNLVHRLLEFVVLAAPEDAPAIDDIVDASKELTIPGEYEPLGWMGKEEGASFSPSMETSESTGYGAATPLSIYTISRSITSSFTMKETSRPVLEMYYGMDLSAIQARATTGTLSWDVPDRPDVRYMRLLLLAVHGSGANQIFHAHFLPRVMVNDIGEQAWSETEDLVYPVTITNLFDSTLGTSQRPFLAGPGLTPAVVAAMKFQAAA